MIKGLRKPIAKPAGTRAGLSCPSRTPGALAPVRRRRDVYSGGGRERGGRVKSRRREGGRLGQRVRPRHDGGGARPTRNAQGASGRSGSRNRARSGRQSPGTISPLQEGRNQGIPPASSALSRRTELSSANDSSSSRRGSDSNSKDDSTSRRGWDSNASHISNASNGTSGSVSNGDCPRSQGQRRGACSISVRPPNSRANARGPNHRAGLPERTHEVPITGLDFE